MRSPVSNAILLALSFSHVVAANDSALPRDIAPPKEGVTVAPPLSENPPPKYTRLPNLGSLSWSTRRLPWVEQGPYAGISGVAMATDGQMIHVAGGFIPGGDETDDQASRRTSRWAWSFDPDSGNWTQLPHLPVRREYTRGVVHQSTFFVVGGGQISKGRMPPYRAYGECAVLDLSGEAPDWKIHSSLNVPRTHTATGNIGSLLVVAGGNEYDIEEKGYSHRTIRDTTEVFDLSHPDRGWQVRSKIPSGGRGWSASVVTNGHLYLFGGLNWTEDGAARRLQETWRYDPRADRWQEMTPPPLPISGWEAGLYADRYALIAGGVTPSASSSASELTWSDLVWAYDCRDDIWLQVDGTLPPGAVFNDPGAVVVQNKLYLLGAEGPHGSHYNYFLLGEINPKHE